MISLQNVIDNIYIGDLFTSKERSIFITHLAKYTSYKKKVIMMTEHTCCNKLKEMKITQDNVSVVTMNSLIGLTTL